MQSGSGQGTLRVAVIEDQEQIREGLRVLIDESPGCGCTSACGTMEDALLQFGRVAPQVALVDIGLPVLSGYDVAREVRTRMGRSDIFLVALTGYGQQQDREAVIEAGFDQHLVKPVDIDTLLEVLRGRRTLRGPS